MSQLKCLLLDDKMDFIHFRVCFFKKKKKMGVGGENSQISLFSEHSINDKMTSPAANQKAL